MRLRYPAFFLVMGLGVLGGAHLRIAKITIKEPSGDRTVFRVCLPGRTPDVFAMTEGDFMCHIYDRYGFRELDGGFGRATEAVVSPASDAAPTLPDERDHQVLETLLLHLLADPKLDLTGVPTNGATIVLHTRTPENTGFLMSGQIHSDIGDRRLPDDAERDLRRRNTAAVKPNSYDSVTAFYTNIAFAGGIVVTNLSELWQGRRSFRSFEDAHARARGWLEAYLPGYSKDGTHAVVRAGVGPWAHSAMLTAVLEKRGDKWVVKWYHISFYV